MRLKNSIKENFALGFVMPVTIPIIFLVLLYKICTIGISAKIQVRHSIGLKDFQSV